jgi:hypothetical protein
MGEIARQINFISNSLWLIQTEVEMRLGKTDYSESLEELIKTIKEHSRNFENYWWETQKS